MHQDHQHRSGARVLLLALGALVLAGVGIQKSGISQLGSHPQGVGSCSLLPGRAGQLCSSYHSAVGPEKFTAAVHWRQLSPATYACSGITVDCLQLDMRSSNSSSCRPLLDGEACDEEQQLTCSRGFCGGRPRYVEPADPNFQAGVSNGFAPVSFGPQPAMQQQQQQPSKNSLLCQVQSLVSSLLSSSSSEDAAAADSELTSAAPRSLQAVSAQVDPSWPTAYGVVKFRDAGRRVPEAFLATSHEWTRLEDYGGDAVGAWSEIFKMLSPSPVLRLGGATQDKLVDPPKDSTWIALAQLQKKTNARFVIGLPLFQKNAVEMSRQMIGQAKKYLGSSVIGYELGNEPEFWPNGLGGYDEQGNWKSGFGPYSQWFDRVARTLNPCGTSAFLSGPGWGNVNTQDPNWLRIVLSNGRACGYLWEANTHYYPYIDNATVTADQLLAQPLQDFGMDRFRNYVRIASSHSLPLRVSEANSLYGGGRAGLSDTMAGTLWVADALFAFANASAQAFHLHWGLGGLPYEGGSPNVGVQTNFDYNTPYPYKPYPSVHAPWFGYLFWVVASAGGYGRNADTQFVSAWMERKPPTPSANVVTEKGNQTGSNRRTASPAALKAWQAAQRRQAAKRVQQQHQKKPTALPQAPKVGTKPAMLATAAHAAPKKAAVPARKPAVATGGVPAAGAKGQAATVQQKGRRLLAALQAGGCDANLKIWALKASDSVLRVVLLNKDSSKSCNVKVMIPDASHLCKQGQKAELSRLLPGPEGMSSKAGLSWQGQHYEDASVATSGKLVGDKAVAQVFATKDADGCAYVVGMPKTSGALLVINA